MRLCFTVNLIYTFINLIAPKITEDEKNLIVECSNHLMNNKLASFVKEHKEEIKKSPLFIRFILEEEIKEVGINFITLENFKNDRNKIKNLKLKVDLLKYNDKNLSVSNLAKSLYNYISEYEFTKLDEKIIKRNEEIINNLKIEMAKKKANSQECTNTDFQKDLELYSLLERIYKSRKMEKIKENHYFSSEVIDYFDVMVLLVSDEFKLFKKLFIEKEEAHSSVENEVSKEIKEELKLQNMMKDVYDFIDSGMRYNKYNSEFMTLFDKKGMHIAILNLNNKLSSLNQSIYYIEQNKVKREKNDQSS